MIGENWIIKCQLRLVEGAILAEVITKPLLMRIGEIGGKTQQRDESQFHSRK